MADYDIEKVKRLSKAPKTDYFKNPNKKQKQKKQKKKTTTSFWDVPSQYTTDDNSDLNYDYLELEKKLKVATKQWGVENISKQIIELIKNYYHKFKQDNPNNNNFTLLETFYPLAETALKKGYQQTQNVLPPLPQDIKKLILATYSQSIEKLKVWRENKLSQIQEETTEKTVEPPPVEKLSKDISNLMIEQGIYLEEQKVHHPIINTKR
ncbi:hypothetical protein [Halanaerobacter jeridensis]|uniref:Uncharacterized protein n=1 Tax=Halanaerobacter jeridensis TaxID=706427 RepID=A0A938XN97_9FIRM|nr:hypothetical protein [Halanaerobacter jeridensis]MBM7555493.1 hypothetical protein [Halanaerobacter jeridensis]